MVLNTEVVAIDQQPVAAEQVEAVECGTARQPPHSAMSPLSAGAASPAPRAATSAASGTYFYLVWVT